MVMRNKDEDFKAVLKSIMETEVPPENIPNEAVDLLLQDGHIEEHGNRKFHVTQSGALLYGEIFLRLKRKE